ncbi:hypothetical protein RB195_016928 [Necator americanus]|uniref:7TM GPCR serpentine receptor class x (Srx) domain-containing protein n=1 Tax=Necator americanus TaxID=51031 RepID=A0ABR1C6I7_NECAM
MDSRLWRRGNLFPPEDNVGRIAELVVGIPYAAIPVIQLGAAYNRVIAIYLPFSYDKLCNKRLALMTIGLGLCYGTFITLHEIFAKCRFVYNPNILSWNYLDCKRQVLELKFIYPVVIMAAMTILMNLFTATRVLVETSEPLTDCATPLLKDKSGTNLPNPNG